MDALLTLDGLVALLTLAALEIVLGVDNLVFISIVTGRLPAAQQPLARKLGLGLALGSRLLLLFTISWMMGLTRPLIFVALNSAAECVLRLKADEQNEVPVVADAARQVMEDSVRLDHSRCGDNHRGAVVRIQRLQVAHLPYISKQREVEQLVGGLDHPLAPVEYLWVEPEYRSDIHRERAVDIDRGSPGISPAR